MVYRTRITDEPYPGKERRKLAHPQFLRKEPMAEKNLEERGASPTITKNSSLFLSPSGKILGKRGPIDQGLEEISGIIHWRRIWRISSRCTRP
ncbi:MAG TPA: hypothetical protein VF372_06330, partial [Thermodesulfobacteriota bacterium]